MDHGSEYVRPVLECRNFMMTQEQKMLDVADTVRFVLEIDRLKGVLRKVRPVGEDRYENTAEHHTLLLGADVSDGDRSLRDPLLRKDR